MSQGTVLVVDDERNIVETLTYTLQREGFRVLVTRDGLAALDVARRELPDLVLLDWMLPALDGLEVCRRLKQDPKTRHIPVMLLTVKSSETDKVLGLELGADDYVTKPFSPRELLARIKAVLRRGRAAPAESLRLGALEINWGTHVVAVGRKPVELTAKEFELLKALIEAKGRVLSREKLLERVWGYERAMDIETRTVDLHVSQLRKKLKRVAQRLLTIKGTGYRFVLDA